MNYFYETTMLFYIYIITIVSWKTGDLIVNRKQQKGEHGLFFKKINAVRMKR